ncbi:hypothetical protein [Streptomyces sp. BPTC-684]|uniref:hypothetical protein n=1 Tax=Streptomyces sp. BPTC-684 TaxID=3043734 RepID=UPI0024B0A2F2|nr:hypothetical protein [Streptomyces sp. BPTC-684]WHM41130.1 hypothetical protein QIY60_32585 [Streptomyces sp. BPTC-684]
MPSLALSLVPAHIPPLEARTDPTAALADGSVTDNPALGLVQWMLTTPVGFGFTVALLIAGACLFDARVRKAIAPLWRLVTGGLVFVEPGAWDSTWSRPAPHRPENQPMFRGERVPRTRWAKAPGYIRMAVRWGLALYGWALYAAPWLTLAASIALVVSVAVHRALRLVQDRVFNRTMGVFAQGAAVLLDDGSDPRRWIAAPKVRLTWLPVALDPRITRAARKVSEGLEHKLGRLAIPMLRIPLEDDDARIRVSLDAGLINKPMIQELGRLGTARIPEGPWKAHHHEAGLVLEFKHPERPPADVVYDQDASRQFAVTEVPIGKKAGGHWATIKLADLTPHTVMSATTGWCKTTLANVYLAHVLGNGARAFINDPKRIGYVSAFGQLPNVTIHTTARGWQKANDIFLAEMERRYEFIERYPEIKENPLDYFEPWFLVNDERGSYVSDLKDLAKADEEKGLPLTLRKEKKILWQSRAAGMYMLDLAQQANLPVFIDSDGRDQRMARIASGPQTRSSWVMLFPGVSKRSIPMKKGRAMYGIGVDSPVEIQLARITDEEARAFAIGGIAIGERENAARADRLKALTEGAAGSVAPSDSPTSPDKIASSVPGQSRDTATGAPEEPNGYFLKGNNPAGETANAGQRIIENAQSIIPAASAENDQQTSGSVAGGDISEEGLIVGMAGGAAFLEMTYDGFKKARERRPIPGETRKGIQPAWTELTLNEWRAQAPRAGAN